MTTKLFLKMYSRTAVRLCYCCCLLLLFAGCEEKNAGNETPDEKPALSVAPAGISAPAAGGSYTFAVSSNAAWSAAVAGGATWCAVSPTAATGNSTGVIVVAGNPASEARTATVTFTSGTLTHATTVTQEAADPTLSVDVTGILFDKNAGSQSIAVTSNAAWTAAVDAAATWCTVSPTAGTGHGAVTVRVAENPTLAARAATVTLTAGTLTHTVAVTQIADDAALTVDPTALVAVNTADSYTIDVTCNMAWTAAVNAAATWCTLSNASATGHGAVTVYVTANPAIEARAATITVTAGSLIQTVAVTQHAADVTLTVDKTSLSAVNTAGSYTLAVTSNAAWAAGINPEAAAWCTLDAAAATGNGTVTVHVAGNATAVQRAATITIAAGTLTRTVAVTQAASVLSLDKTEIAATAAAGSYTIDVTSVQAWSAEVNTAAAPWCMVSPTYYAGIQRTVTVSVAENPAGVQRAATLTFTSGAISRQVTVTQAAALLTANPTAIPAVKAAGSYAIEVTNNTRWSASVSNYSAPPYSYSGANSWCAVPNGWFTGDGTAVVTVAANPTVEARAATVTLAAGGLTQQVNITQEAGDPTLEVSKPAIEATANVGQYTISVSSNTAWTATLNTAATWSTLVNSAGTGNSGFTLDVTGNVEALPRAATLTVTAVAPNRQTAVKEVVLAQAPAPAAPAHAATSNIWYVHAPSDLSSQFWSDHINMPECDKADYDGGDEYTPNADCRSYTHEGHTYYYYSWPYVVMRADDLCPDPWRVPDYYDPQTWYSIFSRRNPDASPPIILQDIMSNWGGDEAGYLGETGYIWPENGAYYWCNAGWGSYQALYMGYNANEVYYATHKVFADNQSTGMQVRCVH